MGYLEKALKIADEFREWNKISDQRRHTLEDAINATADTVVSEIIRGNKWHDCSETRASESEAVKIQHEIMAGRGKLIDFREACEKWKNAGTK
jgi:hypothetical protein